MRDADDRLEALVVRCEACELGKAGKLDRGRDAHLSELDWLPEPLLHRPVSFVCGSARFTGH
ncbi:MAG: hypothetical protein KDB33_13910 [Acidimicrobiales bacterium]|nr:hypothetical protein [Acidimicrobiales bacterium]